MPQYASYEGREDKPWKLRTRPPGGVRQALRGLGYPYAVTPKRARMNRIYQRAQCCQLWYDMVSDDDIMLFIAQRGLKSVVRGNSRLAMQGMLEDADQAFMFEHWPKLPEELKLRVFEWFFMAPSYGEISGEKMISDRAKQPPITLASRETRRISLPVYYRTYRFQMFLGQEMDNGVWEHGFSSLGCILWTRQDACEYISKLSLGATILLRSATYGQRHGLGIVLEVDLSDGGSVTSTPELDDISVRNAERKTLALVQQMATRRGTRRFRSEDIGMFIKALDGR